MQEHQEHTDKTMTDKVQNRVAETRERFADSASELTENVQERIEEGRDRIAEGTEKLSEEARARVIAARRRALEAHRAAKRQASRGADVLSDFYDKHPLVVGALAVAAGAALAGALPRTKTEDNYLGDHSDKLFNEAERIFEEETRKLGAVAEAARDEAEKIASEVKKDLDSGAPGDRTAAEALADTANAAGKRVAAAARDEARKEKLGDPTA